VQFPPAAESPRKAADHNKPDGGVNRRSREKRGLAIRRDAKSAKWSASHEYNSGMNSSSVHVDIRSDGVAVFTLDQPNSKVNVLTEQLWTDLEAAIDSLAARTDGKGLVLASAKPGVFIAGADLKLLGNAAGPNDPAVKAFMEQGLRVLEKLESLPFPTCAAIDGAALGGGLEVALACDCRVLSNNPKVQLGLPEVKLGLIPGWGGTQRLPRIVAQCYSPDRGMTIAADLLTTGNSIDWKQANDLDSLIEVHDSSILTDEAARTVSKSYLIDYRKENRHRKLQAITPTPSQVVAPPVGLTGAAAEAVRVMIEGAKLPLYEAIKLETAAFLRLAGSPESKRLIAEFFAGRRK
jgi:enoyl-CoA hydratase